jgi:ubiquinone/menaquinone biosynthesis C-methylase UbiE
MSSLFELLNKVPDAFKYSGMVRQSDMSSSQVVSFLGKLRKISDPVISGLISENLAHWSRQWEHPYLLSAILSYSQMNRKDSMKILESACGMTSPPFILAGLGHHVTGVDVYSDCNELWEDPRIAMKGNGSAVFKVGNSKQLPFESATFDCGFCISSLEHMTNPEIAVSELIRVTKPGGLIVITCDVQSEGLGLRIDDFDVINQLLDDKTDYFFPARWSHPSEVLTFQNRFEETRHPVRRLLSKLYRSYRPMPWDNLAIYATARIVK